MLLKLEVEANDLKASINDTEASIRTLTDNLRTIRTFDLEPAINIKNRLTRQINRLDRIERASKLANEIKENKSWCNRINRGNWYNSNRLSKG